MIATENTIFKLASLPVSLLCVRVCVCVLCRQRTMEETGCEIIYHAPMAHVVKVEMKPRE